MYEFVDNLFHKFIHINDFAYIYFQTKLFTPNLPQTFTFICFILIMPTIQ